MALGTVWGADTWAADAWGDGTWGDAVAAQTKIGGDDAPRGAKKDNVGFDLARWKREKQKPDEALEKTIEAAYKRIYQGIEPEEAKEVLAPVIKPRARVADVPKPVQVNWAAAALREEIAQWVAQAEQERDDEDASAMLLL